MCVCVCVCVCREREREGEKEREFDTHLKRNEETLVKLYKTMTVLMLPCGCEKWLLIKKY